MASPSIFTHSGTPGVSFVLADGVQNWDLVPDTQLLALLMPAAERLEVADTKRPDLDLADVAHEKTTSTCTVR